MRHENSEKILVRQHDGILHSVLYGLLFAAVIIGLITFTNYAASHMATADSARSDVRTASAPHSHTSLTSETTLTPKSKLVAQPNTEPQPATQQVADGSDSSAPSSSLHCTAAARRTIVTAFNSLMKSENTLHQDTLSAILSSRAKTGLVTQLLNPGMISTKLTAENARHHEAVKSLMTKEISQLTAIHCS